jgi:peptidyl-prolyl cis-trans isomerase C
MNDMRMYLRHRLNPGSFCRILAALVATSSAAVITVGLHGKPASGAEPTTPATAATPAAPMPAASSKAAYVDGKPIYVGQVDQMFATATHGREVAGDGAARIKAAILYQLVKRQFVQNYLDKTGAAATADDVDAEITHMKTELARGGKTLDQYLARSHQSDAMLRAEILWRLSWPKFLKSQLTDAALAAFFSAHHQEFDGTELRVSHILLRPNNAADESAVVNAVHEAQEIRKQIESGQITFEAAAEKYSAGPSRHHGGDLGFIPRHGLMVEPFSKAAFALKKDEISQPVLTTFGVHLIRVTGSRPGDKSLAEVHDAVQQALVEALFERFVAQESGKQPVEYTGQTPYFKPGTTELMAK